MTSDIKMDARVVSIEKYLEDRGFSFVRKGRYKYCISPFSKEKTPSFCVYPTNTFYDWSTGVGGDVIRLVELMDGVEFLEAVDYLNEGEYPVANPVVEKEKPEFVIDKFITKNKKDVIEIRKYAINRGIFSGYIPSKFSVYDGESFIRRIAVGYVHVDENLSVCGIKMRDIDPFDGNRFSARGSQKYYILKNYKEYNDDIPLYITESESSANSLMEFFKILKYKSIVISFGSWSNVLDDLPNIYSKSRNRFLILDYDGDEDKIPYSEKVEKFNHLNATPITLKLNKGEDINSLFVQGKLFKYKNQII